MNQTMRLLPRLAGTAIASTALLLSTGMAAHAQSETVKDKTSDVVAYTSEDTDENGALLSYQDSLDSGIDIRSMRVKHTKKSFSVSLAFAELTRDPSITIAFRIPGKSEPQWFLNSSSRTKGHIYDAKEKKVCSVKLTRLG